MAGSVAYKSLVRYEDFRVIGGMNCEHKRFKVENKTHKIETVKIISCKGMDSGVQG